MSRIYLPRKPRGCLAAGLMLGLVTLPAGTRDEQHVQPQSRPVLREVRTDKLSKYILAFDISSDSDLAAAASDDLRVRIWRLSSGDVVNEISFPEPDTDRRQKLEDEVEPISVRFSPDGKLLAISFLSVIRLYEVGTWQEKLSLGVAGEDDLRPGLTVTPKDQLRKRSAQEAEAERAKPVPNVNQRMREWAVLRERGDGRTRITDFAFTKDGSAILAAYCRGGCYASPVLRRSAFPTGKDPVRLWDVHSGRIVWEAQYDPKGVIERVVPSPDGKRFAAVNVELGRCAVGIYDLSDGSEQISLPFRPSCDPPPGVFFLRDGQSFATARAEEGGHGNKPWRNMAIYESTTGRMIEEFSRDSTIRDADVSSDGRWLASTSWWGMRFQIWDLGTKTPVIEKTPKKWKWKGPPIDRIRFSPDVRWLIIGNDETGNLIVYQFSAATRSPKARPS